MNDTASSLLSRASPFRHDVPLSKEQLAALKQGKPLPAQKPPVPTVTLVEVDDDGEEIGPVMQGNESLVEDPDTDDEEEDEFFDCEEPPAKIVTSEQYELMSPSERAAWGDGLVIVDTAVAESEEEEATDPNQQALVPVQQAHRSSSSSGGGIRLSSVVKAAVIGGMLLYFLPVAGATTVATGTLGSASTAETCALVPYVASNPAATTTVVNGFQWVASQLASGYSMVSIASFLSKATGIRVVPQWVSNAASWCGLTAGNGTAPNMGQQSLALMPPPPNPNLGTGTFNPTGAANTPLTTTVETFAPPPPVLPVNGTCNPTGAVNTPLTTTVGTFAPPTVTPPPIPTLSNGTCPVLTTPPPFTPPPVSSVGSGVPPVFGPDLPPPSSFTPPVSTNGTGTFSSMGGQGSAFTTGIGTFAAAPVTWSDWAAGWVGWVAGGADALLKKIFDNTAGAAWSYVADSAWGKQALESCGVMVNGVLQSPTGQAATSFLSEVKTAMGSKVADLRGSWSLFDWACKAVEGAGSAAASHPYLTAAVAIIAIGYWMSRPATIQGSDPSVTLQTYKRIVKCSRGEFLVEIQGAKGMSEEEIHAALEIAERRVISNLGAFSKGDKFEVSFNSEKEISYKKIPVDKTVSYRPEELTFSYRVPETDLEVQKEVSLLHGNVTGKGRVYVEALATYTKDRTAQIQIGPGIPPIGFVHDSNNCTLNSTMQSLLAIPEVMQKMKGCGNAVLREIATQYEALLKRGKGGMINLNKLREQFRPGFWHRHSRGTNVNLADGQQHEAEDYRKAIFELMGEAHQPLYKRMGAITTGTADNPQPLDSQAELALRWNEASKWYPELYEQLTPTKAAGGLQKLYADGLFGVDLDVPGTHNSTLFETAPPYLSIHLGRWTTANGTRTFDPTEIDAPLTLTHPKAYLRDPNAGDANYALGSFIVHSGGLNGGHDVHYRREIQMIDGVPTPFYWKIDDVANGGQPQSISEQEYLAAAKKAAYYFYVREDQIQPLAIDPTVAAQPEAESHYTSQRGTVQISKPPSTLGKVVSALNPLAYVGSSSSN